LPEKARGITAHQWCVRAPSLARSDHHLNNTNQLNHTTIMKTLMSVLVALSVLAGVAASANAFDTKTFYDQQDRESH
jgi:hypothetical protein